MQYSNMKKYLCKNIVTFSVILEIKCCISNDQNNFNLILFFFITYPFKLEGFIYMFKRSIKSEYKNAVYIKYRTQNDKVLEKRRCQKTL